MNDMQVDFNKIKLVVWDLDDTFWRGTLSEGGAEPVQDNITLVKVLTDIGVVNSICSKNDSVLATQLLEEMGIAEFFVFKSIDWTPKGQRILQMIKDMGLRNVNVLFIDDNPVNINEASHYCDGLMTADPSILSDFLNWAKNQDSKDFKHSRLKQYKILENKVKSRGNFSTNLDFLYSTNTEVCIHRDCLPQIDRLYELIHRTNQLNYTKKRISKEELEFILKDSSFDTGYVTVKDKFGDYGIVGFFAIKNNKAVHFLFSCRAIGQGVEQWVFSTLNYPEIDVAGTVITKLEKIPAPLWINQTISPKRASSNKKTEASEPLKILFKGACDLSIITSYIVSSAGIINEFTYVGELRHNEIEHHNHSVNYLSFPFLENKDRATLLEECIFMDPNIFDTHLFDKDLDLIVVSTLIEPNLAIYKRRGTNIKFAFGEWETDLTDPNNWDKLICGDLNNYMNSFTREYLDYFSKRYEYLGRITPNQYVHNLEVLLSKISPNAHLCLILGSEVAFERETNPVYFNRAEDHKRFNEAIRRYVKGNSRISLIEISDFIEGQRSFTNNINHFDRSVYFKISEQLKIIIAKQTGHTLKHISKVKRFIKKVGANYKDRLNPNAWYYPFLYNFFKRITHN